MMINLIAIVFVILTLFFVIFVCSVFRLRDSKTQNDGNKYSKLIVDSVYSQNTFPDIGTVLDWLKESDLESDFGAAMK